MTDDKLEFIVPYGGPLLDRLRASGPRLHHLAYKVHDLVQEMEQYIDQGFEFLSAGPVTGIGNTLVNFIMPEDRGVMIELVQECQ
jgi:hypothetical protein